MNWIFQMEISHCMCISIFSDINIIRRFKCNLKRFLKQITFNLAFFSHFNWFLFILFSFLSHCNSEQQQKQNWLQLFCNASSNGLYSMELKLLQCNCSFAIQNGEFSMWIEANMRFKHIGVFRCCSLLGVWMKSMKLLSGLSSSFNEFFAKYQCYHRSIRRSNTHPHTYTDAHTMDKKRTKYKVENSLPLYRRGRKFDSVLPVLFFTRFGLFSLSLVQSTITLIGLVLLLSFYNYYLHFFSVLHRFVSFRFIVHRRQNCVYRNERCIICFVERGLGTCHSHRS